jgi:hypothetical protein
MAGNKLPFGACLLATLLLSGCARPARREVGVVATDSALAEEAWGTVRAINRAWVVTRDLDSISRMFHPEMVGIYPGTGERMEGRETIVADYRRFLGSATVPRYDELRPRIRIYAGGRVAVVTYYYDMEYVYEGRRMTTAGQSMYTLVRENGRWLAVAQQYQPLPGRGM